jgi:hypothetical protein
MRTRRHDGSESSVSTATMEDPRAPGGSTARSLSGEVNWIRRLNLTHWVSLPINLSARKLVSDMGVILRHWNPCTEGGRTDCIQRVRSETGREATPTLTSRQADKDFHVWLANSQDDDKSETVVVEVSPRIRGQHVSSTITNLKRLVKNQAQVRISGWIPLDPGHPKQLGKTRKTLWEIHPILKTELFSGGRSREL